MLKDIVVGVRSHEQAVGFLTVFADDSFYFIGQPVQFIVQRGYMPVQRYGDVRFYLFHLIRYLTVLQFAFNCPPVSKRERELTLLHYVVLAYLRNETGKPTL